MLGAANRLDIEELASFDREDGSSASMIRSGESCLTLSVVQVSMQRLQICWITSTAICIAAAA